VKKAVFIIFIFLAGWTKAQKDSAQKFKLGFSIGFNYSGLATERRISGQIYRKSEFNGPGFRMGIVAERSFGKHFSLLPKTELSFNDAGYIVENSPGSYERRYLYPVTLEFAGHMAFKGGNVKRRPYLLFGPALKLPLPGPADPYLSNTRTATIATDIGFGFDKPLKNFEISPEIRYSHGLNKITNVSGLDKVSFHTISLVLNFKG
jgi:hypothetical protein